MYTKMFIEALLIIVKNQKRPEHLSVTRQTNCDRFIQWNTQIQKQITDKCNNMDESETGQARWKKSESKGYIYAVKFH